MGTDYVQYVAADVLSHVLPRRLSYWIGERVADGCFRRDEKGRRAVTSNLRKIREYQGEMCTEKAIEGGARQLFRNFGKYLVDFFRFTHVSRREITRMIRIVNPEYIGRAVARGKGVLVVTAHLGSWEIGGAMLSSFGYPVSAVVLPMKDRRTNALFQSRREQRGVKVIPIEHAAHGIYRALERKEFVALLGDRDYGPHHHEVTFFGAPACLPIGPAKLSVRTGAPILPGFMIRQPDDTFLLRLHPPLEASGLDAETMQDRVVRVLESEISQNPSQWFIFNEFWKHSEELSRG